MKQRNWNLSGLLYGFFLFMAAATIGLVIALVPEVRLYAIAGAATMGVLLHGARILTREQRRRRRAADIRSTRTFQ